MATPVSSPPFLAGFDGFKALADLGQLREFPTGATIFSAGDAGDGFYVIESGRVAIVGDKTSGANRPLAVIEQGDFFGEMAVLDEGVRSASAVAETPTRTRFLRRDEFLRLLQDRPEFALELFCAFSTRLRTLNQRYLEDMLHTERLATVGRLARATVHDFKNPLAVISLATEMIGQPGLSAEAVARAQKSILTQVSHMNSLLHELIDYTRTSKQAPIFGVLDFTTFLHGEIESLRGELQDRRVELVLEPEPPRVRVRGDALRLSRLLRNLAGNARDAIGPAGGTITVRVVANAAEVVTHVDDSGPGIAPEITPRLFEPFATYGKEHGTGLGLSICKRIVEDHGGRIWASAPSSGGASFSFALPLA